MEDLRSRLTAGADRALPEAGVRPALIILPARGRVDGGSQPAQRRRLSARGSRGRSHPPVPCVHKGYAGYDT